MSTPPPRRRDAIASSDAIERAATDLVYEIGLEAVTVDMICARAAISKRTFFNHFKNKEAAVLGQSAPTLNERAAREFIASTGPLLLEAARLIDVNPGAAETDPELLHRRMVIVARNHPLMAQQMARLAALAPELREIIYLRLKTQSVASSPTQQADGDLREQAELITHLLTGLLNYVGSSWARQIELGAPPVTDPAAIGTLLQTTLSTLAQRPE
ncbi:TetR family transcriptional regulator [Micrococcales bacterium 31B]|nr:TetR family transcriptional regulator [Micrococcales bacterium 31B]